MGAADAVYNLFFKRSTLYIPFVLVGAFFANEAIDKAVNTVWESNNRGVRLFRFSANGTRRARQCAIACAPLRPPPPTRETLTPPPLLSPPPEPHRNCSRTCRRPRAASEPEA
jgi:ubiquinol-cytochrome c reductase subunit 9